MVAEKPASPRIFRIEYTTPARRERGRFLPRRGTAWIKAPYGGLFGLNDALTRAITTGQIESYMVRIARPREITEKVRAELARWPDALAHTSEVTAVDWSR